MLQSHPSNTSFSRHCLTNELQDYINDQKKILFKYTRFAIVGKVRVYIFNMAGQQDTGARGEGKEAGSISAVLLSRS